MSTDSPQFDGETLRRSRSTGDLPSRPREILRPGQVRIASNYRYSESHTHATDRLLSSRTVAFDEHALTQRSDPSPIAHRSPSATRRPWSPPPTVTEDLDHDSILAVPPLDAPALPSLRPQPLSRFGRTMAFFGYGRHASRVRREFVSLIWNLGWGFVQVVTIITVLAFAAHLESPTSPNMNEWEACARPLGIWCCLWVVRVFLACGLSYWAWIRERKSHSDRNQDDSERGTTSGSGQRTTTVQTLPRTQPHAPRAPRNTTHASNTQTTPHEPPLPHAQLYSRLTLLSSLLTLTWFLTAHILEYTSINTCRHSSPHVWWLTFGILCIMYIMVLEVVLLGFVVFILAPILFVFWNILLICLGRHPLQNPTMIKPEIGKLPKSSVERIPLVIYIPPPPDEPSNGPVTVPDAVYAYPPKPPTSKPPKRRFAFLKIVGKRKAAASGDNEATNVNLKGKEAEFTEPLTWEDHWEQGEYPFVRLEGNRAACAICLMDFEEPKRISGAKPITNDESGKTTEKIEAVEEAPQVQEILVDRATDEETAAHLRLADAGEGSLPLRLLTCGHVFHQTCLDPWLIDVSGRCPVCQRPVEVPEPVRRKKNRRRRSA